MNSDYPFEWYEINEGDLIRYYHPSPLESSMPLKLEGEVERKLPENNEYSIVVKITEPMGYKMTQIIRPHDVIEILKRNPVQESMFKE